MKPLARRFRRYFVTGLIVIAPVGLTIFVLQWIFLTLDAILGDPLRRALKVRIPGLGFVLLMLFILVVGWAVRRTAARQLLHWWNEAMARFPLTGRIYNAVSQIIQSVVGEQRRLFRRTVLIPYPTEGIWAVAFVTNENAPVMSSILDEPCVNVFVPTTPNPTSGFMLVVPRARTKPVPIPVEEAMKLIISAGAVSPEDQPQVPGRLGLDIESLLKESKG